MSKQRDSDTERGTSGQDVPLADRRDQQKSPLREDLDEKRKVEAFEDDISRIAVGHRQMTRDFFSANRQGMNNWAVLEREQARKSADEQRREKALERLARWNAQLVTVGGVQMTNEEAQAARLHCIENEDYYANRAVERGLIRDGEQDEFKRAMRRTHELHRRIGSGEADDAEREELRDLTGSRIGGAVDSTTGDIHTSRGIAAHADAKAQSDALPSARDIFQSTPEAQKAFTHAAHATAGSKEPEAPAPAPETIRNAQDIKAIGLDV